MPRVVPCPVVAPSCSDGGGRHTGPRDRVPCVPADAGRTGLRGDRHVRAALFAPGDPPAHLRRSRHRRGACGTHRLRRDRRARARRAPVVLRRGPARAAARDGHRRDVANGARSGLRLGADLRAGARTALPGRRRAGRGAGARDGLSLRGGRRAGAHDRRRMVRGRHHGGRPAGAGGGHPDRRRPVLAGGDDRGRRPGGDRRHDLRAHRAAGEALRTARPPPRGHPYGAAAQDAARSRPAGPVRLRVPADGRVRGDLQLSRLPPQRPAVPDPRRADRAGVPRLPRWHRLLPARRQARGATRPVGRPAGVDGRDAAGPARHPRRPAPAGPAGSGGDDGGVLRCAFDRERLGRCAGCRRPVPGDGPVQPLLLRRIQRPGLERGCTCTRAPAGRRPLPWSRRGSWWRRCSRSPRCVRVSRPGRTPTPRGSSWSP